jgi:hypothetical protein
VEIRWWKVVACRRPSRLRLGFDFDPEMSQSGTTSKQRDTTLPPPTFELEAIEKMFRGYIICYLLEKVANKHNGTASM